MARDRLYTTDIMDTLQNYEIRQPIGQGTRSKVYLATCRKGRLRGREIALKEIPKPTAGELPVHSSTAILHKTLHHPRILSMFSSFSTHNSDYQVLELCKNDTLSSYLKSRPPFSEGEVRGTLKALADALVYLRKEKIVHGSVTLDHVFLTEDYRVKLGNFRSATRISEHHEERLSEDIRCLGRLCIQALTGESTKPLEITCSTKTKRQFLPVTFSTQARDLVRYLMEQCTIPDHILSHPFFDKSLPVISLGETGYRTSSARSKSASTKAESDKLLQVEKAVARKPLANIRNISRSASSNRLPTTNEAELENFHQPTTFVGYPVHTRCDLITTTPRLVTSHLISPPATERQKYPLAHPLSREAESTYGNSEGTSEPLKQDSTQHAGHISRRTVTQSLDRMRSSERPEPFVISPLQPQVYKTPHGHLTILSADELLVDLREGERTRGAKGDTVFTISSKGRVIKAYRAPRLSVPCVLTEKEMIGTWDLEDLPKEYWRRYKFAANFLDQTRRRTPKMTFFTPEARCTLASNGPEADIEVLLPKPSDPPNLFVSPLGGNDGRKPSIRIRMSRDKGSLEISRFIPSRKEKEGKWTKKITGLQDGSEAHVEDDLERDEQDALLHAQQCRKLCEVLERSPEFQDLGMKENWPLTRGRFGLSNDKFQSPATIKSSLKSRIAPRPAKISLTPSSQTMKE